MVVRMRATRGHTGNRRSHHALMGARLSKCSNCGVMQQRHTMCLNCGYYRGRKLVDVQAKMAKKEKKLKEKEKNEVKK